MATTTNSPAADSAAKKDSVQPRPVLPLLKLNKRFDGEREYYEAVRAKSPHYPILRVDPGLGSFDHQRQIMTDTISAVNSHAELLAALQEIDGRAVAIIASNRDAQSFDVKAVLAHFTKFSSIARAAIAQAEKGVGQ